MPSGETWCAHDRASQGYHLDMALLERPREVLVLPTVHDPAIIARSARRVFDIDGVGRDNVVAALEGHGSGRLERERAVKLPRCEYLRDKEIYMTPNNCIPTF